MASVKFKIRGEQNPSNILVRFSNGRKCSFYLNTGYKCNPQYFNNETGKVRQIAEFSKKTSLQSNLTKLEALILDAVELVNTYTKEWLQTVINKHHGKIEDNSRLKLTQLIEKYIDHKTYSSKVVVEESTIKSYKITLFRITAFQKHIGKDYFIDEVGIDFKEDFIKWARVTASYKPSTYNKTIKQLKTICRYAKRKNRTIDESIFMEEEKNGKPQQNKDEKFPVLTQDDIKKLLNYEGAEHLENARDWLIISCWTACRVSDLMNLTTDKIVTTINNEKAINYTQIKTGAKVSVPLHKNVQSVLNKRKGFPRVISHQKYNDYIKNVCKESKINEITKGSKMDSETNRKVEGVFPKYKLITSHIGRRTFATAHYGNMSNFQIMQVTGHTTERQLLEYIGEKDVEHITDFYKFWNTEKEDANKGSEKIG